MIKLTKTNRNFKPLYFPLFYTDPNKTGVWLAIKYQDKVYINNFIDRNRVECKGNRVSVNTLESFTEKYNNGDILEIDVELIY